jgi:hypothetical protein
MLSAAQRVHHIDTLRNRRLPFEKGNFTSLKFLPLTNSLLQLRSLGTHRMALNNLGQ